MGRMVIGSDRSYECTATPMGVARVGRNARILAAREGCACVEIDLKDAPAPSGYGVWSHGPAPAGRPHQHPIPPGARARLIDEGAPAFCARWVVEWAD